MKASIERRENQNLRRALTKLQLVVINRAKRRLCRLKWSANLLNIETPYIETLWLEAECSCLDVLAMSSHSSEGSPCWCSDALYIKISIAMANLAKEHGKATRRAISCKERRCCHLPLNCWVWCPTITANRGMQQRSCFSDRVLCVLCVLCVVGLFSAIGGPRWRYITASVSQEW
jgi:hypothetical protein